jgi:small subunit ribosomal protein S20
VANTKSAKKAIKVQERRRARNQIIKSQVKTSLRRANEGVTGKSEEAQAQVAKAISALDKAVAKGVIHKNQAGRKKSRLMKKLNANATTAQA